MIASGIDVGAKNVKIIILEDGNILGKNTGLMELDRKKSVKETFEDCLEQVGIKRKDIDYTVATGIGKGIVDFAQEKTTIITCDAQGIVKLQPSVRTVIDIGANEARAVKCDHTGKVIDFAVNEKCAAGSGAFVEAMARAMQISLEEFAALSLTSSKVIPINAQCVIFAESEVVSLIHEQTDRNDICRAVHDAMAARIASMARRVRVENDVALIGGVAHNIGMVESLKRELSDELKGRDFINVEDPDYVGAYGAAILALENGK